MPIEIEYNWKRKLTTLMVNGLISAEEMHTALEAIYTDGPTGYIFWDMSQSDLSIITPDELLDFTRKAGQLGKQRKHGHTAILAPEDLHSGFSKLFEYFTQALPFNLKIFRTRKEAMTWLLSEYTVT